MSDPIADPISASNVLGAVVLFLIGLLSWNGKQLIGRVDKIESSLVNVDDYKDDIKSLRKEFRMSHQETQKLIIDLYKNQNGKR